MVSRADLGPPIETPVTRLFGIHVPIIQGAMAWLSEAPLVAAVSNAGGLGVLGASIMTAQELEVHVIEALRLTDMPVGINFPLVLGDYAEHLEMALDHGIRIVMTSAGSPAKLTPRVKQAGALCVHVVPSLRHAQRAAEAGVDALVLESVEAGGHVSPDGITAITNIPHVRRHVRLPLIAAGGIMDGAGMAAALCLGADGVQMGTRFLATAECNAHAIYKQMLLDATETDTPLHSRAVHPGRALRSPAVDAILALEGNGGSPEQVRQFIGRGRARKAAHHGNTEDGLFFSGSGACMVEDLPSAATVVARTVSECRQALARVTRIVG